jgi:DNA-binding response OmpR family regulator
MTHNTAKDPVERRYPSDRRRVPRGGRRARDVPGRHPPVLIADTDDGARRPFVRYLDWFGFQVEEAATGEAAVTIVETRHPKLAIADLTLACDDAFRKGVRERGIPYILTATHDTGFFPPEAAALLMKPFPLALLLEEVRRVLTLSDRAAGGIIGFDRPDNQA